jgi:signal peptidase I
MRLFSRLPPAWRSVADIAVTLILAGAIVWVARAYVMKPYTVPTGSMEPTLMIGDYVIADRISLDFGNPHRYQIVVFHPPHCKSGLNDEQGACTTTDRKARVGAASTTFIKRVIGLPGDTIWQKDGHLWVKRAGAPAFELKEPWVMNHQEVVGTPLPKMHIPKGYYLMLGDNRAISDDSRVWGLEPRGDMIGIARVRYWPLGRIGLL